MARTADKVAVVTGGALGIGAAACMMLAREGAAVAVTDVLEGDGEALAERMRADGGKAQFWALDVTDEVARSEEHTSELQSRENLVCRLLLEKKKKDMA